MKKQKKAYISYVIVFFACLWSCANIADSRGENEYEKAIEKYKYQISYADTYSTEFSDKNRIKEAAAGVGDEEQDRPRLIYLTFDDGPSPRTPEILRILDKHNIKATFFIVENEENYTDYLKQEVEAGHSVGVHSASHKYSEIYSSVDAYLKDFTKCYEYIYKNTGYEPTLLRFPGGSVNKYNKNICRDLVDEMTRRGFAYFDWNVDSGDGTGSLTSRQIYNNVINGCKGKKRAVVLMHDAVNKKSTAEALDDIITELKNQGFEFAPLDNQVKPMVFRIK